MSRFIFSNPVLRTLCRHAVRMSTEATQTRVSPAFISEVPDMETKLSPAYFHQCVTDIGVNFFTGVPDSLLSDYCAYVQANEPAGKHVLAVNEGSAVGLAAGYYLATGNPGLLYLQNSGLGNTVNPLMSLTSPQVYSIPVLLLIGWRGEPGVKDEPQHRTQGHITPDMLRVMDIPYKILPTDESSVKEGEDRIGNRFVMDPFPSKLCPTNYVLQEANDHFVTNKSPFGILVKKSTFTPYKLPALEPKFSLTREAALKIVVGCLGDTDIIVSTTGMLSRELFEYREAKGQGHEKEFLTVGSMGHASSIALGIAKQKTYRQVFCLDGDGAALMHLGSMATVGQRAPDNFKHVIFNNGGHDSVGGQPTESANHDTFSFGAIALGCGYRKSMTATNENELQQGMKDLLETPGPALLEIKLRLGSRKDLGRPTRTPLENKQDFMGYLERF